MQTYVVHNRRPRLLLADLGWRGIAMFQVVLLGMLLSPLLHIGFGLVVVVMLLTGHLTWPQAQLWPLACAAVLILGHGTAIATNMVGLRRAGQPELLRWQVVLPAYWLLIAVATIRALREFAIRPFHWFKTPHMVSPTAASPTEISAKSPPKVSKPRANARRAMGSDR